MNGKDISVTELNAFLKGEYMAIDSYEHFIRSASDRNVKDLLQNIQKDHKRHAIDISERIKEIGGDPVTGVGLSGKFAETISSIKHIRHNDDTSILEDALSGETQGIKMADEIVKGDLDFESASLVSKILETDKRHLSMLEHSIKH